MPQGHFHHVFFIVWAFVAGALIHVWVKADEITQDPNNGLKTYRAYFGRNGSRIVARLFFTWIFFVICEWHASDVLAVAEKYVPWVSGFATDHPNFFRMNVPFGGCLGYFGDSLIRVAQMKIAKRFPSIAEDIPPEPQGNGISVKKTTETVEVMVHDPAPAEPGK